MTNPPHPYAEVPIPAPRNVTAFGDRAFKELKLSTKVYRTGRKAEIGYSEGTCAQQGDALESG